jgi:hypothetical protein
MGKITKAINWAFWPVIGGMMIASLSITIYDRFADLGTARSFYVKRVDATCITTKDHGQSVMFCFDGDRTAELESE